MQIDNRIRFNGVDDDGHETFLVDKSPSSNWEFCKSARKPYDAAVGCCLIILKNANPKKFTFRSDGGYEDWEDVIETYNEIFGQKPANFLPEE